MRAEDNGLSKKGREQAEGLGEYFKKRFSKGDEVKLISSPKKRCQETLEPIAQYLGKRITVSEGLLEEQPNETSEGFQKRVERFLKENSRTSGVVVLCSHGDWLPIALQAACGARTNPKKASWTEIEDGILTRMLTPDDF